VTIVTEVDAYKAHRIRSLAELSRLASVSRRIANSRLAVFLVAAAVVVAVIAHRLGNVCLWSLLVLGLGFIALALAHRRNDAREQRLRLAVAYDERVLARAGDDWQRFPHDGARYASPAHMYAGDLDVFGPASLFQLLNETATRSGEGRLAAWLSAPADATTILGRQAAVRELAPLSDFRRDLVVEAAAEGLDKIDPALFRDWATGPSLDRARWARHLPWLTVPALAVTYILSRDDVVPRIVPILLLLAQIIIAAAVKGTMAHFFNALSVADGGLARLRATFATLERMTFADPLLQTLTRGGDAVRASKALAELDFWYGFAEARRSQLSPVLNALLLWDIVMLFRISRWRDRYGTHIPLWIESLSEMEALCALAGFAHEHPRATYPTLLSGEPELRAEALAHPLLHQAVPNDVSIRGRGHALLLTGSNMSGKSTLLRALGANAVLALAGAPVIATSLALSVFKLATSMRVEDSLERGVSYFYAEVQRLKAVLDVAVENPGRCLFLLDEVLLGTNTRERQIASREILLRLLETGAIGAVTTHDVALTALADESGGRIVNGHFRDHLENGKMSFDYKLRPGIVDTSNALRVLELAGIPVTHAQL
jgi:hypothetical protein